MIQEGIYVRNDNIRERLKVDISQRGVVKQD